jgi:hypothetical protein
MRQLVRQQTISFAAFWSEFSGTEDNLVAGSERTSIQQVSCRRSAPISMDSDPAEIMPKARLHDFSCFRIKRLAGCS